MHKYIATVFGMGINKCKLHHLHCSEEIYNNLLSEHSCYSNLSVSTNSLMAPSCHYLSSFSYFRTELLQFQRVNGSYLVIQALRLVILLVKQIVSTKGG